MRQPLEVAWTLLLIWQVQISTLEEQRVSTMKPRRKLKLRVNSASAPRSCGTCGLTIRMREYKKTVLCTEILEIVDSDFEDVCEHYVERSESTGLLV
jgi:hypothetical protein